MKTITVRVTAKIVKDIEVEIPDHIKEEDKEEYAMNEAGTIFSPLNDGYEEKYSEDYEIVIDA